MNWIIETVLQILVATNMAFAAALSYKESITNNKNKKTVNGFLWIPFKFMVDLGSLFYGMSIALVRDKKDKEDGKPDSFSMVMGVLAMIGFSVLANIIFATISSSIEDAGVFIKLLNTVKITLLQTLYYGFVYGLFGGENGRLRNSALTKLTNSIISKADKWDVADFKDDLKSAVKTADTELHAAMEHKKGESFNVVNYLKSSVAKVITTFAKHIKGLSSVPVDITSFASYLIVFTMCFIYKAISTFVWSHSGGSDIGSVDTAEALLNPVSVVTDQIKSFLITMVVMVVIKILVKIILLILPDTISDAVYSASNKLHDKLKSKVDATDKVSEEKADSLMKKLKLAEGNKKARRN